MNRMKSFLFPSALVGIAIALPILVSGCKSSESGPDRYDLSGSVSFGGKPVPAGEITFSPDASQGNSGPGCIAMIENGQYKTDPESGIVGGPYTIQILGFDGIAVEQSAEGTSIFPPYGTTVDLPKENTTHNFDVPEA